MPNTVTPVHTATPPPPPPPPPQTPAPAHSSPPARPPIAPFVSLVAVLLAHVISCPSASTHTLTDKRVDCLLCLSLEPRKLLLRLPFEIPVRPFRRNVEYILQALSCVRCWRVSLPTSSWALCCSSSAMTFSAIPSTFFSTVSWVNLPFCVCFLSVRVSGSKFRFSSTDPLHSTRQQTLVAGDVQRTHCQHLRVPPFCF